MKCIYFLSINSIQFVPYAYGLLRSYAEQDAKIAENYIWKEPLCRMKHVEAIVEQIVEPDILCASCYVWNHNQQAQIAGKVKEKYPRCKVIFGGPHVPEESGFYFSEYPGVDVIVHGEGEIPFSRLLIELLEDSPNLQKIDGITLNQNHTPIKTPRSAQLPKNLPMPSPYLKGFFDHFLSEGNSSKIALWETNRGCPYSCSFCDWGVRTMNKLRLHDLDKIIQEIEYMGIHKVEDIYISDCNFGIFRRDLELAKKLVESKKKYGYPKRVRIQFAKNSNDTVFEISKLLHENDMLWGTTLSMQSVDMNVLEAIDRHHIGIKNYKKLKDRYLEAGIPTYTELILGLPLETRDSFINGICTLFDIGIHDDIRVFELALLPNAPISRREERKKYGLQTKMKPLRLSDDGNALEKVELVFGTSTMHYDDWVYCFLFGEAAQALHNGAYTRFLAMYLNDHQLLSYQAFYDHLLEFMLTKESDCFMPFRRIKKLIQDFHDDPSMPQINRLLTQPDIMEFLRSYNPQRKGWQPWTYLWLSLSESMDALYENVCIFLNQHGIASDNMLMDLIQYQKDIIIQLNYDPISGKQVTYQWNWFDYFFENKKLQEGVYTIRYTDTHTGPSHRYPLEKNNKKKFLDAAMGISYPYTKFRHFFHQPDMTQKIRSSAL